MPTVNSSNQIVPTRDTICTEALKRAGYPSPTSDQLRRARDEWLTEIIHDIWFYAQADGNTRLKSLHRTAVSTALTGQRRYDIPIDCDEDLVLSIMDGTNTYELNAAGTSTSIVIPSATLSETAAVGHFVYLYNTGSGKQQFRECTAINIGVPTDKSTLTVDEAFDTDKEPANLDKLIVVDRLYNLGEIGVRESDFRIQQSSTGRPYEFFRYRDQLHLDRAPDKEYCIRMRYYSNPMKLKVTDTLFTDLLSNWQSVLVKGVLKLGLQNNDDGSQQMAAQEYMQAREILTLKEIDWGGQKVQFVAEGDSDMGGVWSDTT